MESVNQLLRNAAEQRARFAHWETTHMKDTARAKYAEFALQGTPFLPDIQAWNEFKRLDNLTLGLVMQYTTQKFLQANGYRGAKSNKGNTLSPAYTAILNKVVDKFGRDAVCLSEDTGTTFGFRAIAAQEEVIRYFQAEMQKLFDTIMEQVRKDLVTVFAASAQ